LSWTSIQYVDLHVAKLGDPAWLPLLPDEDHRHLVATSLHIDQELNEKDARLMKKGTCVRNMLAKLTEFTLPLFWPTTLIRKVPIRLPALLKALAGSGKRKRRGNRQARQVHPKSS
jgi:hypothetical protein